MTIQFLTSWNGHEFGTVADLGGAEAGLIAARLARAWTPGIDQYSDVTAGLRFNAAGAVVGVVGRNPAGAEIVIPIEAGAALPTPPAAGKVLSSTGSGAGAYDWTDPTGGGVSTIAATTDKATVDLPTINTPTATAFATRDTAIAAKPSLQSGALAASTALAASPTAVLNAIAALVNSAPGTLDTLNELASALGSDPNFATTMATALSNKLATSAGAVGTTNLAAGAVTSAKMADLATGTTLGRSDAGTGAVQAVPNTTLAAALQPSLIANDLAASSTVAPSKTAVNTALALKADALAPVSLGTGAIALNYASHANRYLYRTSGAAVTMTVDLSTGSPPLGTVWSVYNPSTASGNLSWPSGTLLAAGTSLNILPGAESQAELTSEGLKVISPVAGAGVAPVTVSGSTVNGSVLTRTLGAGWTETGGNWTRDGANISGATSPTYTTVSADGPHVVTWKSTSIPYIPTGISVAAVGDTTAPVKSTITVEDAAPTKIVITFDEDLDQTQTATGWAAAFAVSAGHTISATAWGSTVRKLELTTSAFVNGETARTLTFTQSGSINLQDAAGNKVATFTAQAITNNVAAAATTGENFNGADSTTVMGYQQTWTQHVGTWGTTSNKGYCVSLTGKNLATYDTGITGHKKVSFKMPNQNGDYRAAGLIYAYNTTSQWVGLKVDCSSGTMHHGYFDTSFHSNGTASGSAAVAAGDTIEVWYLDDGTTRVFVNGIENTTITCSWGGGSYLTTSTRVGLYSETDTAGNTFDDITVVANP